MRDLLLCVPRKVLSPNDFTDTTQIRDRLAVFDLTWAKIVDLRVLRVAELRVYRMIMDLVRTNREVRGGLAAWRRLRWRTVITRFGGAGDADRALDVGLRRPMAGRSGVARADDEDVAVLKAAAWPPSPPAPAPSPPRTLLDAIRKIHICKINLGGRH